MGYGYPLTPDTVWWDELTKPVSDDMRREDGRRTFGLMELAVRAPWRRQGVARRLHEILLDALVYGPAGHPRASPVRRRSVYRRPRAGTGLGGCTDGCFVDGSPCVRIGAERPARPKPGHVYVELVSGPLDGILLDVTGWDLQEVLDRAMLMSEDGRCVWRGGVP